MHHFWAFSLRRQLLIAILLLLVPVAAAMIWSAIATYRERVADLSEQSRVVALNAAASMNRDLGLLDREAEVLTGLDLVQALDSAGAEELLQRVLATRPNVEDVMLVAADGTLVASGGSSPPLVDARQDWLREVLERRERTVTGVRGEQGSLTALAFAYPVAGAGGRVVGALAYVLSPEAMQDTFARLPLPEGSVVTTLDEDGRVIARSLDPERYIGQTLHAAGTSVSPRSPAVRVGPDGTRRMYGEATVEHGPWLITVGIPLSVATGKAMSLWMRGFAVLGLGVAGWLIVALVFSRRLSDAVSHLDATAQRIAGGDFRPMEHASPMLSREFAELQTAFALMLQRFNATRHTLDAQMAEERAMRGELESLQGQVIRQERLAAVGQLVSGVAHEINNPLQAILGFAELLQMQEDLPDSVKGDLHIIQKETARACGIIKNLALFARQQPAEAAPVKLTDVIRSVIELRQRRLESENIHLEVDDRSMQPVMAVSPELQQVVLNFVINAEQAMIVSRRLPGRLTIRTFDVDGRVVLEAEDTGPGVPPEHEFKLFQPFFTTKPVGQGTGLGLSVSYGIIDSLGGQIGYRRAPAGGSIFYFDLPAAPDVTA